MKRYLKIFTLGIMILSILFVIGCGANQASTEGAKTGEEVNSGQEAKIYKVGTDAAYAPFESMAPNGDIEGFDIDVLKAIAEAEGFKVEFENTKWEGILANLATGKKDIIISSLTITEERKKEVDFSDPYFESTNYIVVPKDSSVASLEDLKGKTMAVQQGTTGDIALTEFLGEDYTGIKRFGGNPEAFLELKNGKVDAVVADSGVVVEYVKNNPGENLKIVVDDAFPKEEYGIAVKKGNTELLNKINSGLKKIRDNGKYDEIYSKWGFK